MVALAALVPPCPSVPPGAGNKPKKAIKPRKRAKNVEEGYVGGTDRHMDAAAIRRHDDGDLASISGTEPAQWGLHVEPQRSCDVAAV
jgi:hypothetical protein